MSMHVGIVAHAFDIRVETTLISLDEADALGDGARARSLCAEMHFGLAAIPERRPMNLRAQKEPGPWPDEIVNEIARLARSSPSLEVRTCSVTSRSRMRSSLRSFAVS